MKKKTVGVTQNKEIDRDKPGAKKGKVERRVFQTQGPKPPKDSQGEIADRRKEFAKRKSTKQLSTERVGDYQKRKLKLVLANAKLREQERQDAMYELGADLGEDGGVSSTNGFGVFYETDFRESFLTGTAISWEIICPRTAGGNVSKWIYLTATNRSSKGVEALVSYNGQNDLMFQVFDWSLPTNRWVLKKPFSELGKYLGTDQVDGVPCQVIGVMNSTYEKSPGNWINEVSLYNVERSGWDLVYDRSYQSTLTEQNHGWVGTWGPIVETFQPVYANTNLMGALKTQISSRDAGGQWGAWIQIGENQTDFNLTNSGLRAEIIDPNFNWTCTS